MCHCLYLKYPVQLHVGHCPLHLNLFSKVPEHSNSFHNIHDRVFLLNSSTLLIFFAERKAYSS